MIRNARGNSQSTPVSNAREILTAGLRERLDVYGALEFGSVARGKSNPNDYDLIIIADHKFVIPRNFYEHLSKLALSVHLETGMRVEMLVRDRTTVSTFFSDVGRAFRAHLDDHGRVMMGSDPRKLLTNSFPDMVASFIGKVPDFGLFVEVSDREVNRLSSARRHATMFDLYTSTNDHVSFGKAMSKLKMAEHARNVLILNGIQLSYEDIEGIFKGMCRLYGPEIAEGARRIETLRQEEMKPDERIVLFFDALKLRETMAQLLVRDLNQVLRQTSY